MCFFCLFVWFLFFGWNGACFLTGFLGCSRLCFYFFPLNPRSWHSALLLCITFCSDGHLLACCHLLSSLLSLLPDLSVFISLFFFWLLFFFSSQHPFCYLFLPSEQPRTMGCSRALPDRQRNPTLAQNGQVFRVPHCSGIGCKPHWEKCDLRCLCS